MYSLSHSSLLADQTSHSKCQCCSAALWQWDVRFTRSFLLHAQLGLIYNLSFCSWIHRVFNFRLSKGKKIVTIKYKAEWLYRVCLVVPVVLRRMKQHWKHWSCTQYPAHCSSCMTALGSKFCNMTSSTWFSSCVWLFCFYPHNLPVT